MTPQEYGTWWAQPPHKRRWAYFLCLRNNYGMTSREALAYIRETEAKYPGFISDSFVEHIKKELKTE